MLEENAKMDTPTIEEFPIFLDIAIEEYQTQLMIWNEFDQHIERSAFIDSHTHTQEPNNDNF